MSSYYSILAILHGCFYVATGVWPLVSIESFQRVTGAKTDLWLVRTVGVLVSIIGLTLLLAGVREARSTEVFVLAVGSALSLAAIDTFYVFRKVIPPVYLLDAVAELILVAAWLAVASIPLA